VFSRLKIDRDRNRLKRCEPLWTANGLTPVTPCPHRGYIDETKVCPVCHKAGLDGHPLLERSPATDPKPEPKAPPPPPKKPLTRREIRKLLRLMKPTNKPQAVA
jgi:hypothetical protein